MKTVFFSFFVLLTSFLSAQTPQLSPVSNDPVNQLKVNRDFPVETSNEKISRGQSSIDDVLFLINGKEISREELDLINPDDIESITVYKDKEIIKKYGAEDKTGVVLIRMKDENYKIPQQIDVNSTPLIK